MMTLALMMLVATTSGAGEPAALEHAALFASKIATVKVVADIRLASDRTLKDRRRILRTLI